MVNLGISIYRDGVTYKLYDSNFQVCFPNSDLISETLENHVCMLSHFSRVRLYVTLRTAAHQTPLSMGFSRQDYWSGLPFPSPGDLPDPGMEPESPALASGFFTTSATWAALENHTSMVLFLFI